MRTALLVFLTSLLASCSRPPPDATPEGVVREWLGRMSEEESDPAMARTAWDLLSQSTHHALEERAERASLIEGRRVGPRDVLAPGRFALRFTPSHFATNIQGTTALVEVAGDAPAEHASLHCVKEGKVWRLDLILPELTALPHRPDAP